LQHVPGLAPQLQPHRFAAVAVPEQDLRAGRADRVPVAPLHQGHQHGIEVEALLGQPVLVPLALTALLVRDLAQEALADQAGQPVAEHLAGHSGAALHVGEAADAVEGLA